MNGCNGPCEQGRKACPTPWACEVDEPPEHDMASVVLKDLLISAVVIAVIAVIVLGVVG